MATSSIAPKDVDRFWSKVDKSAGPDGCWLWKGAKSSYGYGVVYNRVRNERAHRAAWALRHGPIPDGLCICHHCDNPPCVNPDHLFLGTKKDNSQDMIQKGRGVAQAHPEKMPRGKRHGSRTHPERVPRGSRHGSQTHPESTARGEKHGCAKLTDEQVRQIRTLHASAGIGSWRLAKMFNISITSTKDIIRRKTWNHLH